MNIDSLSLSTLSTLKHKPTSQAKKNKYFNQEIQFTIIGKIKKRFPTNNFYISFFILMKFLGVLVITHSSFPTSSSSSTTKSNENNLAFYLRKILYFKSLTSNMDSYCFLCFLIYSFVLLTLLILFFYWRDYSINYKYKKLIKEQNGGKFRLIIFYIMCFMINLIVLFSQHFIEILSIIYLDIYLNETTKISNLNSTHGNTNTPQNDLNIRNFISTFESNLIINKYFFCVFNLIFIVIINIITYLYFKYLNEPFISSKTSMKYSTKKSFILVLVLLSNLTAIHPLDIVYPNSLNIKLTQLIIGSLLLLYHLTTYNKFLYCNLINCLVMTFSFYCIISILFDLLLILVSNQQNKNNDSSSNPSSSSVKITLLRLIIELALSKIFSYFTIQYKKKKNISLISEIIFHKTKGMSLSSLYEITELLKKGIYNTRDLNEIFRIINKHRNNCKEKACSCKNYEIENFLVKFKSAFNQRMTHDDYIIINFQENFNEIIVLFEHEIMKSVNNITNKSSEELEKIEEYLILHVDYISWFRRKTQMSLYLKNRYSKLRLNNYLFNFYLHLLEKKIIKLEKESIFHQHENFNRDVKYLDIYNYINLLNSIQSLMVKNLENYEKLIKYKNTYNNLVIKGNNKMDKSNIKINAEDLLFTCLDLNRDYQDLIVSIIKEFRHSNLKNAELCFLVYNFYKLLDKTIPPEVESSFVSIKDYGSLQSFETSFEEKDLSHPMILTLRDSKFLVSYISQKLCDALGYKREELILQDFHRLLPQCIVEEHAVMIKKYLLYDRNSYFKKETFALAKNGYFFPVRGVLSVLPGMNENTYIADLQPAHNDIIEREKSFVIILDRAFNLITFNEEFEDKFFISLEMMRKMDVDVLGLFGITHYQLLNEFKDDLLQIESNNHHWEDLVEIFNCPDLNLLLKDEKNILSKNKDMKRLQYRLRQNLELSNELKELKEHNDKKYKFGANFLKSKVIYRRKNVLIPYLQKLQSMIVENEFPREWLSRLNELEKNLLKTYTPIKYSSNKNGGSTSPVNSTNIVKNNANDLLKIEVQLRNMVNLPYYLIRMWDSSSENLDQNVNIKQKISRKSFLINSMMKRVEENININFKDRKGSTLNGIMYPEHDQDNLGEENIFEEDENSVTSSQSLPEVIKIENENPLKLTNNHSKLTDNEILEEEKGQDTLLRNKHDKHGRSNLLDDTEIIGDKIFLPKTEMSKKKLIYENFDNNESFGKIGKIIIEESKEKISRTSSSKKDIGRFLSKLKSNGEFGEADKNATGSGVDKNLNIENSSSNLIPMSISLSKEIPVDQTKSSSFLKLKKNQSRKYVVNSPSRFKSIQSKDQSNFDGTNINNSSQNTSISILNYNQSNGTGIHKQYQRRVEFKKKYKGMKKSVINFLLLFVTLLILSFISIYNVFFSTKILQNSLKLFYINSNTMNLKSSITYCSITIFSACLKSGGLDSSSVDLRQLELNNYQILFKNRAQEMFYYVYKLKKFISTSGSIKNIQEVYDIIGRYDNYSALAENWQVFTRSSSFRDELDYFHYYTANLQNEDLWNKCEVNNNGLLFKGKYIPASFGEKTTFYTLQNIMHKFSINLNDLTSTSSRLLQNFHIDSKKELLIFNIVIVIVFLTLGLTIVLSIVQYRNKINSVLKKLFEIKKEDDIFEKRLMNFKTVLLCLDRSVGEQYEENNLSISRESTMNKEYDKHYSSKRETKAKYDISNKTGSCLFSSSNVMHVVNITTNVNNSNANLLSQLNTGQNKEKHMIESLNSQVKNYSSNSIGKGKAKDKTSSTEKQKKREKAIQDYDKLKDKETNLLSENFKENFEDYFYISFVKSSFVIIIIFNIFYIILVLVNIVTNMNDFDSLLFSNRIALNFMDRVPRFMDLILYYKVSILLNDVNFIVKPQKSYISYSDFYNVLNAQINLKDDTLFSSLPQSEFSFLLYMLQVQRNNIKSFLDDKYISILPNTRALEKLFNSKEACLILGMKSLDYAPDRDDETSKYNFSNWFSLMSNYTSECKNSNIGMNSNGFDLAIDNHISNLVNLYLDFNKSRSTNRNQNISSAKTFLTDVNFLRAQRNAEYTLKRYHNSLISIIEPDIEDQYDKITKKEYIFSALKIIFALSFIVYFIFLVILRLQNYANNLKTGINKFKKAVG